MTWPLPRLLVVALAFFVAGMLTTLGMAYGSGAMRQWQASRDGVVLAPTAEAEDGYVLIAPAGSGDVQLIRKSGQIVHSWELDIPVRTMAELMPDGSLMYIGEAPQGEGGRGPVGVDRGAGLIRVSWDGRTVWTQDDVDIHHDFAVLPDGALAALKTQEMTSEIAARVAGGIPDSELNGRMWEDLIVEIDPTTHEEVSAFEAARNLRPEDLPLPEWMRRDEWLHLNSLVYTPSDPITGQEAYLTSSRALSTVFLVSRSTGDVVWQYGGKWVLNQQHDPSLLENGHVLLFDNGQYLRGVPSSSQVIEVDPLTNEAVWTFPAARQPFTDIYSSIVSGAQRLSNGNTLITLGVPGRVLEVTPSGDVVWEYREPGHRPFFKLRSYARAMVDPLLGDS